MIAVSPSPFVRRVSTWAAALTLGATLSACSEAVLDVEDASVLTKAEGTASSPAASAPVGALDPALEATPLALGPFSLNLPLGWAAIDGVPGVSGGPTSTAAGAGTYTAAPAAGKDQAAWVQEMLAGTSTVVEEREGLVQNPDVVIADGRTMFHITHTYSDNRAHLFGLVADEQLHMIRFGLDGTVPTSEIVAKAVATAVYTGAGASTAPAFSAASVAP